MDVDLQTDMEEYFLENTDMLPADQAIELGFFMMDPLLRQGDDGHRLPLRAQRPAAVQQRHPGHPAARLFHQAGGALFPGHPHGHHHLRSVLNDIPVPGYYGEGSTEEGPSNYSLDYTGSMNVDRAIEQSPERPGGVAGQGAHPPGGV